MIRTSKYNGIDFTARHNEDWVNFQYPSQFFSTSDKISLIFDVDAINLNVVLKWFPLNDSAYAPDFDFYFMPFGYDKHIVAVEVDMGLVNPGIGYFELKNSNEAIYSSLVEVMPAIQLLPSTLILGWNTDNRRGVFNVGGHQCRLGLRVADTWFKRPHTRADETTFEYSYGRKLIISSQVYEVENHKFGYNRPLSLYEQNVVRWLCSLQNCNLNGVKYNKMGDWNESGSDGSELSMLSADFVLAEPDQFSGGQFTAPICINKHTLDKSAIYTAQYGKIYQ